MNGSEPTPSQFYMEKWQLVPDGPAIQTATGLLCPVVRDHTNLMLKIISHDGDEQNSRSALAHYNGFGAVKVLDHAEDAFVMQRAMPGLSLVTFRKTHGDEEATKTAADVLKKLHGSQTKQSTTDIPLLSSLRSGFVTIDLANQDVLPSSMLVSAQKMFDQLLATTAHSVVLHGDLHHENMLLDRENGWLAIDPKGFMGDPVYDCAALFKNPLGDHSIAGEECISSRADILAVQLGYSRDRILHWAYVHCVMSVLWSLEDELPPGPALDVALILNKYLQL